MYIIPQIRIGESYNLFSSISGTTLAEYNIFTRSSTLGRKSLQKILETDDNPLAIKKLKIQNNYINANADILNAKLKGIGLRIKFLNDKEEIPDLLEDTIMPIYINGYVIYDTPLNKPMYNKLFLAFNKYLREHSVIEAYKGQKEEVAWKYVFELQEIKELNISEEVKNMLLKSTIEKYQNVEEEVVVIKGKRKKRVLNSECDEESCDDINTIVNDDEIEDEIVEIENEEENEESETEAI
jgi:hypothetical protein